MNDGNKINNEEKEEIKNINESLILKKININKNKKINSLFNK